jgi:ketosteroid isomerase-like protein
MKLRGKAVTVVVAMAVAVVVSGCGGSRTGDRAADEAAIRKSLDEIARSFNAGNYDAMFAQYRDDVLVSAPGQPEIVGKAAWREGLAKLPANVDLRMRFDTQELDVSGDLGYERGTFTMDMLDKASGAKVGSITNRHVHIYRREPDGRWLGWRLIENSPDATPAGPPAPAPAPSSP